MAERGPADVVSLPNVILTWQIRGKQLAAASIADDSNDDDDDCRYTDSLLSLAFFYLPLFHFGEL